MIRRGLLRGLLAVLLAPIGASRASRTERDADLPPPRPLAGFKTEVGLASWYGPGFHGRKTASGKAYDQEAPMCAHRTLPFGTLLRVTNMETGLVCWTIVRDRGPFIAGRIVDLSRFSARQIGLLQPGVARVRLEVMP